MIQFSSVNTPADTLLSEWNTTDVEPPGSPVPADSIPKKEKNLRVHMNLWLIDSDKCTIGDPPSDGQEVEVIVQDVRFPDTDNDGIFDEVDVEPTIPSVIFSDGTTTGTITVPGNQTFKIKDALLPNEGVLITVESSGESIPATVTMAGGNCTSNSQPFVGQLTLIPGNQVVVTCGSITTKVLSGPVEITYIADDGTPATTTLGTGNSLTFEPTTFTFTTPATNSATSVILVNGTEFTLAPAATITIAQFENLTAEVEIEEDEFEVEGSFTLGATSDGIDPLNEDATLELGTFITTIPAGSFELDDEEFEFEGIIGGIELEMKITPRGGDVFDFKVEGEDVDLTGTVNPVTVSLTIWGDKGTTSVIAEIEDDDDDNDGEDDNEGHDDEDDEGHDGHHETHIRIADETPAETNLPEGYTLEQNYPNPFNPTTTITFAVPVAGKVTLAIYNLRGQLIQTLYSGAIAAGRHSVVWNGTNSRGAKVASGIYVYKLKTKDFVATRKLVFAKSLRSED